MAHMTGFLFPLESSALACRGYYITFRKKCNGFFQIYCPRDFSLYAAGDEMLAFHKKPWYDI